jgi:hypothetical protein
MPSIVCLNAAREGSWAAGAGCGGAGGAGGRESATTGATGTIGAATTGGAEGAVTDKGGLETEGGGLDAPPGLESGEAKPNIVAWAGAATAVGL